MIGALLVLVGLAGVKAGGQGEAAYPGGRHDLDVARQRWQQQDLHLTGGMVQSQTVAPGQHVLVCQEGFTLAVAGRQYTSRSAVVWICPNPSPGPDGSTKGCQVQVYLTGRPAIRRTTEGKDLDLTETPLEREKALVLRMALRGEVFVTTDRSEAGDPRSLPLYREGVEAFRKVGLSLPPVPPIPPAPAPPKAAPAPAEPNKPPVGYTISVAPLTSVTPKVERTVTPDGQEIITFIGRTYVWWEQPAALEGQPAQRMEVEADNLVLWRRTPEAKANQAEAFVEKEAGISDIYAAGNIQFRQGQWTITADNFYYDLQGQRGVANNVVLKTFDVTRGVPLYVRAKELRQISETQFEGQDIVLTTSEFAKPQFSATAGLIRVENRTPAGETPASAPPSDIQVEARNVRFKYGSVTIFALPKFSANADRPDLPIRGVRGGYDSTFGAAVETRWYLNRLLGLNEPAGTTSTLDVDYFSKRGPGGGVEVGYQRETYFGSLLGYIIDDHGVDRLSRTRKDVDVPEDLRGRFFLQHRQYLPYNWQLTAEVSYLSDQNFLEQFYRTEYNIGKEQETLLYLKRIQDNWGLAFLGKVRINDFMDQVEELPSAEYHLTGQSLFDDLFTFYSDTQVSQYRYRFAPDNPAAQTEPHNFFLFTGTRNELDLPLKLGENKVVPFVAGTFGYDDGPEFHAGLDGEPAHPETAIGIGEAGVRVAPQPFWSVYPDVQSRLWDLNQMRHVIAPTLTAVKYVASEEVAEQRDTLDLGLAQRWQTKRGPLYDLRTVNWLEVNTDFVWVSDSRPETAGADRLLWNAPFIPLTDRAARVIPPIDRRSTDLFGPRQNYASADAILRLTDTTAILADGYYGMQTGDVEQVDAGLSRIVWPDLSYYVGNRYLRRFFTESGERTSNALTFAITYILNPRYTLVFSDQYDYGIGANITSEVSLIRKYHRMNLALTFSVDGTMDETRVVLGLWPEGIPELGLGMRDQMNIGASDVYD